MSWNKPEKIWQWLALLSPGAVSVAFTAFGYFFLSGDKEMAAGFLGLVVALLMCIVIAFLLAKGAQSAGGMLGLALLFTISLVIVNFSIGFGGCALMLR